MGSLFVVSTPIGNLEDVTLRALRVLGDVQLVAAEDTRTTGILLRKYNIGTPVLSYNEHNMRRRTPQLIAALESGNVALVSDAGTPGVSDPGHELIRAAIAAGFSVVPIPGPSAVITALTASGLPMRQFTFLGFLPRRGAERRRVMASAAVEPRTIVVFEAPHRLGQTFEDIREAFGDRPLAVCRELTKAFEEVFRGTTAEALRHFKEPRGEFTIVIEGATKEQPVTDEDVQRYLMEARDRGLSGRDAVKAASAATGRPRSDVYVLWLKLAKDG